MTEYEFELTFALPDSEANGEDYLDALYDAGCDDALVGVGQLGTIGLSFTREAESAEEAVSSAIDNVCAAVPGAELAEAKPDLVTLTEVAELAQFSRQYARKMAPQFPRPVFTGRKIQLWHLSEVALVAGAKIPAPAAEVSRVIQRLNVEREQQRVDRMTA